MKPFGIVTVLLAGMLSILPAQEGVLDPSIFDGTGREREKSLPQPPSTAPETEASETESEPGSAAENENVPPAPVPEPTTKETAPSAPEAPQEIILPGAEEIVEEEGTSPPGTPANSSAQESRAGERVDSTEKIVPGQAVDYPWDM